MDYYAILGIATNASNTALKQQYRLLSKKYHPDMHGDQAMMIRINEAYRTLSSPHLRFVYDKTRAQKAVAMAASSAKSAASTDNYRWRTPTRSQRRFGKFFIFFAVSFCLIITLVSVGTAYNNASNTPTAVAVTNPPALYTSGAIATPAAAANAANANPATGPEASTGANPASSTGAQSGYLNCAINQSNCVPAAPSPSAYIRRHKRSLQSD